MVVQTNTPSMPTDGRVAPSGQYMTRRGERWRSDRPRPVARVSPLRVESDL
jgi:hypothetical protein